MSLIKQLNPDVLTLDIDTRMDWAGVSLPPDAPAPHAGHYDLLPDHARIKATLNALEHGAVDFLPRGASRRRKH
jgi:chemotaxis response regulator CheB